LGHRLGNLQKSFDESSVENGDGGGVGIARSLATSVSHQNGVGGSSRIDILAVTRYA
ncbi:hypothetical protein Tco_0552505, partial [Tanacetum coccineum]